MKTTIKFKKYINNVPLQGVKDIIYTRSGGKVSYLNGKLHCENHPAYVGSDGLKQWYFNGKRHRVDGPAIEYSNGNKEWFLEGEFYRPEEEYWKALKEYKK